MRITGIDCEGSMEKEEDKVILDSDISIASFKILFNFCFSHSFC